MKTKTDWLVGLLITLGILSVVYLSSCKKETQEIKPKAYIATMTAKGTTTSLDYRKNNIQCLSQVECKQGDDLSIFAIGKDSITCIISVQEVGYNAIKVKEVRGYKMVGASYRIP